MADRLPAEVGSDSDCCHVVVFTNTVPYNTIRVIENLVAFLSN